MSGRRSLNYVRSRYGVPAKRGMRVTCDGLEGIIVGGQGNYLRVRIDGEKHLSTWHPTWRVTYHAAEASVLPAEGSEWNEMPGGNDA